MFAGGPTLEVKSGNEMIVRIVFTGRNYPVADQLPRSNRGVVHTAVRPAPVQRRFAIHRILLPPSSE